MINLTKDTALEIQAVEDKLGLTECQSQALDLFIKTGGRIRETARQYGCRHSNIQKLLKSVQDKAQERGFNPALKLKGILPEHHDLKGVSIYYRENQETGEFEPKGYWYKSAANKKDEQIQEAFLNAFKNSIKLPKLPKEPSYTNSKLVTEYIITDYHLGMLAWEGEGGDNWDIKIAESLIIKWFAQAIAKSEPSQNAIFVQLGDFLHYDGLVPVTPASKHVLDADSRFALVVEVALRIIRTIIDMLLTKHQVVTVILAEGNHDEASSVWLRKCFNLFYANNDRVIIDDSNIPYYAVQYGNVSLYYHHGHKKPMKNLDSTLTAIFPQIFGSTKHRYAACGHYHHSKKEESGLMEVEQYPTLAARDAYAARGGYISGRSASVHTYHIEHGRITTHKITPEMVKEEVA